MIDSYKLNKLSVLPTEPAAHVQDLHWRVNWTPDSPDPKGSGNLMPDGPQYLLP